MSESLVLTSGNVRWSPETSIKLHVQVIFTRLWPVDCVLLCDSIGLHILPGNSISGNTQYAERR